MQKQLTVTAVDSAVSLKCGLTPRRRQTTFHGCSVCGKENEDRRWVVDWLLIGS